ncbi:MAG: hypothetical protein DSY46_05680 [Hydrogenimonas sp.]|nr:MAG: hypothetical protein DSY46_05680 [Hydrogenimonas sp.]
MNLPVIDIPIQLPFDVPLLLHPLFVHFAIAIPVIVLVLELVNAKMNRPALSMMSFSFLTLLMVIYLGAFFTGKADGSEAFALLSDHAKEELKFHKVLGTYLVYATILLFVTKVIAMFVKQNWSRNLFLAILVIFIAILFKQGKDGGELVYEYGVNVKAVSEVQDRLEDMEYDIEDLRKELKATKEGTHATTESEAPVTEEHHSAPAEATPAHETAPAEAEHHVPAHHEESVPAEMHEAMPHDTHIAPAESHDMAPHHEVTEPAPVHEEAPAHHEEHHTPAPSTHDAHTPHHDEAAHEDTTPVHIPTH